MQKLDDDKRSFGLAFDKIACAKAQLNPDYHTATYTSCCLTLIDEEHELDDGERLVGIVKPSDPSFRRKFVIANFTQCGVK